MKNVFYVFLLIATLNVFPGCASTEEISSVALPEATTLYQKAIQQYKVRRWHEAGILFRQYIRNYPTTDLYRVALYYLGHCEQMLANKKDALLIYNSVITKFPDDDFWVAAAKRRVEEMKSP